MLVFVTLVILPRSLFFSFDTFTLCHLYHFITHVYCRSSPLPFLSFINLVALITFLIMSRCPFISKTYDRHVNFTIALFCHFITFRLLSLLSFCPLSRRSFRYFSLFFSLSGSLSCYHYLKE